MMCELKCKVCGEVGHMQRGGSAYNVIMCSDHYNELHCELMKGKPRKAVEQNNLMLHRFHRAYSEEHIDVKNWINAEHELFLITQKVVEGMRKKYNKKK